MLLVAAIVFTACGEKAKVVYDIPFGQMVAGAQETGKDFCVVISRTDCPPCAEYVKALTNGRWGVFADVAYNIVG